MTNAAIAPESTTVEGLVLIHTADGLPAVMSRRIEIEDGGIWAVTGFWADATFEPLGVGSTLTGAFFLMGERTWRVAKVNPKTVVFEDAATGERVKQEI